MGKETHGELRCAAVRLGIAVAFQGSSLESESWAYRCGSWKHLCLHQWPAGVSLTCKLLQVARSKALGGLILSFPIPFLQIHSYATAGNNLTANVAEHYCAPLQTKLSWEVAVCRRNRTGLTQLSQ